MKRYLFAATALAMLGAGVPAASAIEGVPQVTGLEPILAGIARVEYASAYVENDTVTAELNLQKDGLAVVAIPPAVTNSQTRQFSSTACDPGCSSADGDYPAQAIELQLPGGFRYTYESECGLNDVTWKAVGRPEVVYQPIVSATAVGLLAVLEYQATSSGVICGAAFEGGEGHFGTAINPLGAFTSIPQLGPLYDAVDEVLDETDLRDLDLPRNILDVLLGAIDYLTMP